LAGRGQITKGTRTRVARRATLTPEVADQTISPAPAVRDWPNVPTGLPGSESAPVESLLDQCFQELVHYYRYFCIGRLSQGLIHRMNTPLQVLSFQLELLEQKSKEELRILPEVGNPVGEKLQTLQRYRREKIRQFRQELENIQTLIRSIDRQGGYEDSEDRLEIDLTEVWRRELDLYLSHPFFRHGVEKRFHFEEGLPAIQGRYLDFSQSFRNLLDNALEAMEGLDKCCLTVVTSQEGGQRLLHLGDTGPGIPPEIRSRVFEPFFTTKGRAGLGLFMARRLLAPYGGEIRINSIPGETWVTVSLPVK
jgi:two-component system, NtrC family, sensor kinase